MEEALREVEFEDDVAMLWIIGGEA